MYLSQCCDQRSWPACQYAGLHLGQACDVRPIPLLLLQRVDGTAPRHTCTYVFCGCVLVRPSGCPARTLRHPTCVSTAVSMAQSIARVTFNRFDNDSDGFLSPVVCGVVFGFGTPVALRLTPAHGVVASRNSRTCAVRSSLWMWTWRVFDRCSLVRYSPTTRTGRCWRACVNIVWLALPAMNVDPTYSLSFEEVFLVFWAVEIHNQALAHGSKTGSSLDQRPDCPWYVVQELNRTIHPFPSPEECRYRRVTVPGRRVVPEPVQPSAQCSAYEDLEMHHRED